MGIHFSRLRSLAKTNTAQQSVHPGWGASRGVDPGIFLRLIIFPLGRRHVRPPQRGYPTKNTRDEPQTVGTPLAKLKLQ